MEKTVSQYCCALAVLKRDLGWEWRSEQVWEEDGSPGETHISLLKPECRGLLMMIAVSPAQEDDFLVLFDKNGQISLGDEHDHWPIFRYHLAALEVPTETLRAIEEIA